MINLLFSGTSSMQVAATASSCALRCCCTCSTCQTKGSGHVFADHAPVEMTYGTDWIPNTTYCACVPVCRDQGSCQQPLLSRQQIPLPLRDNKTLVTSLV